MTTLTLHSQSIRSRKLAFKKDRNANISAFKQTCTSGMLKFNFEKIPRLNSFQMERNLKLNDNI